MYEIFPNVDDDVGIEVLSRLPFNFLLRFRNINKSWRRIIDSPFFRKIHIEKQLSSHYHDDDPLLLNLIRTSFIDDGQYKQSQELSIMHLRTQKSYNHFPSYQDFLNNNLSNSSQTVHGLICIYRSIPSTDPIALCNPSLGEIKMLPSSPPSLVGGWCWRQVGLGYDDLEKDYKIVQFSHVDSRPCHVVEVYSRKRNTWWALADHADHKRYIVGDPLQQRHVQPSSAVVAHWIGKVWDSTYGVSRSYHAIVSFDMRSDALKVMKITCVDHSEIVKIYAKEESSFTMLADLDRSVTIWEYKREWIKVGTLRLIIPATVLWPKTIWVLWPMTVWKSSGLILKTPWKKSKLLLFDMESRKIVKRFNFPYKPDSYIDFIEYRGSFISP